MYRCSQCNEVVPARVPRQCINVYRDAIYQYRRGVHKKTVYEKGRKVEKWFDDPGGKGKKIAAEVQVCAACLGKHFAAQMAQEMPVAVTQPTPKLEVSSVISPERRVGRLYNFRDRKGA